MAERFFYEGSINGIVQLDGAEHNHLANIMRAKCGDSVVLFNGDGNDYFGQITSINKKFTQISIDLCQPNPNEPRVALTLFQAVAKPDRMEYITQKVTELGAGRIIPVQTRFCQRSTVRRERLLKIAIEAAKQCGRSSVPEVGEQMSFDAMLEQLGGFDAVIMPYENESERAASEALSQIADCRNIAIIVGSEGGFSAEECAAATHYGAKLISLGKRILRTDTAAIVTAALVMNQCGEFRR